MTVWMRCPRLWVRGQTFRVDEIVAHAPCIKEIAPGVAYTCCPGAGGSRCLHCIGRRQRWPKMRRAVESGGPCAAIACTRATTPSIIPSQNRAGVTGNRLGQAPPVALLHIAGHGVSVKCCLAENPSTDPTRFDNHLWVRRSGGRCARRHIGHGNGVDSLKGGETPLYCPSVKSAGQ